MTKYEELTAALEAQRTIIKEAEAKLQELQTQLAAYQAALEPEIVLMAQVWADGQKPKPTGLAVSRAGYVKPEHPYKLAFEASGYAVYYK